MTRGVGRHSPPNITHHLRGIDFPAGKQELVEHARKNGADLEVLETIEKMPEEKYASMADVMKGIGKID